MAKLHQLVAFAEEEYLRDFVDGRLLPAVREHSSLNARDRLAFLFLQKTTKILHAICALNRSDLGEEATVLARTIFEYSIRLAYINAGSTDSEINARVRAFIGRGYEDQQQKQNEIAALKGQGKCLELIADIEAVAPGQTPLHTEKDWEDFPNEKRMAKELGEPYECDWLFLYWSMSKIVHPTAINLLGAIPSDTHLPVDGERALLVGFTNHYRIAAIVCSALGTAGNALKKDLDATATGFLTLTKTIPTNRKSETQFLNLSATMALNWRRGLLRLWLILSLAWLAVSGALLIPALVKPRPASPESGMIEQSVIISRNLQNDNTSSEKKRLYEEALRRGLLLSIQPMADRSGMLEITLQNGTKIDNVPFNADPADVERRIGNFLSMEWHTKLRYALAILTVPPLALLVFGFATRWIVRGFTTKS